jgi:thiamine transporter ThiT
MEALYSLLYNGGFMLFETLITAAAAVALAASAPKLLTRQK